MRTLLPLVLVALLAWPAGAQPIATDVAATFELHERNGEYVFRTSCAGSRFLPLDDGFVFQEDAPGSTGRGLGCGEAERPLHLPTGSRLLLVSFDAAGVVASTTGEEGRLTQAVELRDVNGALLLRVPFEAPPGGARVVLPRMEIPARVDRLDLVWVFADPGVQPVRSVPAVDPGDAHQTRIDRVDIAFGGVPADGATASWSEVRSARSLTPQLRLHVPLADEVMERYDVAVRLQSPPSLRLHLVQGPQGPVEVSPATDERAGSLGRVVIPRVATQEQGSGGYTILLRDNDGVQLSPLLAVVAGILVLAPLPLAALAFGGIRTFGRQAFGRFRRSAARLRVAVVLALLYYVVVVAAAIAGQRLFHLAAVPPTGEAWLLYSQLVLALAAFVVLWLVARDLAAITRPGPGTRGE